MSDIKDRAVVDRPVQDADASADAPPPDAVAPLAAHLQGLHPQASRAMVRRSIDDATAMFVHARVRHFLPILIERVASATLRAALGPNGRPDDAAWPGVPAVEVSCPLPVRTP